MRAGRLRHQVEIQQYTATRDAAGQEIRDWTEFATVRADVMPLSGREFFDAAQYNVEISHRVRIRYRPGVTTKMRVIHEGRVLDIEYVINKDERDRELHLMCIEVTS